jgi:multiple sugar transport system substrate-binding protein
MKKVLAICIALSLAAVVTACGSNSADSTSAGKSSASAPVSSGNKVSIKFYSYNLAVAGPQRDGTQKLIDEFEAAHPNIKVEGVPVSDIYTKVQADIVAGASPDVAQLIFDGMDYAVHNFNAKPLEDIAPADEFKKNFEGFAPNGLKLGQLNGKTYGLPFTISTPILFYNAKLFKDAGLNPEKPPATWAEVKEDALQIAKKTGATGVHTGGFKFDWTMQLLIGSNGGKVLSDDRKKIQFGEPAAVEAIKMWQDLIASGANDKMNDDEAIEAMSQGKVGMLLHSSSWQGTFLKAAKAGGWELKAAPMPSFSGKPVTPVSSGSALFILSNDKAKQQAAWEFLKFMTSNRGYTIITSEIGYLPLRPAIVDDPQYLKDWADKNPLVQPNLKQLEKLQPWVSFPGQNWRQIQTILHDSVLKSIQGSGDITPIMQDAQERAQALMP